MIGASQNSHSCDSAPLPANSATAVERAGLTEVLVTGMEIRWIKVSASPMASGANPAGARPSVAPMITIRNMAVSVISLIKACRHAVASRRKGPIAVAGKGAGHIGKQGETGLPAGDQVQHQTSQRAAQYLGEQVGQQLSSLKTSAGPQSDAHGRVEMTAGNMPKCIGAGQYGQAEGQ